MPALWGCWMKRNPAVYRAFSYTTPRYLATEVNPHVLQRLAIRIECPSDSCDALLRGGKINKPDQYQAAFQHPITRLWESDRPKLRHLFQVHRCENQNSHVAGAINEQI
jgi:hypothetical protein